MLSDFASKIKPPPTTVLDSGFDGVLEGLQRLRDGKVSGAKLVVKY